MPSRAPGVELLGAYEGSGFKEQPYLVRRADGQVIQLPRLLYEVVAALDESPTYENLAARAGGTVERALEPDDVRFLVEEKIAPLGLTGAASETTAGATQTDATGAGAPPVASPILALKLRHAIIPPGGVRAVGRLFSALFHPVLIVAVLGGLVALDVWLFGHHGLAQGLRLVLYRPSLMLALLGLVVGSAAFHEIGHASGCVAGGGAPGEMGAGIYIVWPAFYTDVTDAYRLDRRGRLRTDLGGVYFNVIFALGAAGAYALTHFEPLILFIALTHLEILHQFMPFVRLDGYYIVSDLTGVPDLFARIKPILGSLVPWRRTDDKVRELTRRARVAVTAWVLIVVPVLTLVLVEIVAHLPRILGTAADSFGRQLGTTRDAFGRGAVLLGAAGIMQALLLALPMIGLPWTLVRLGRRGIGATWTRTDGRPIARAALTALLIALTAFAVWSWWPGPQYRPIQPWERGTIGESVAVVRHPRLRALSPAQTPGGAVVPTPAAQPSASSAPASATTVQPSSSSAASPSRSASAGPSATASASPSPSASVTASTSTEPSP